MTTGKNHTPPKWADRFLEWYCTAQHIEEVQGDLYEAFFLRCNESGVAWARFLFIVDVFRSLSWRTVSQKAVTTNSIPMFRNYFIIGYRNLLRNKVFSLINISGLAIGLAACFFIVLYVRFEMSYDRFHTKSDRIFRVTNYRFQGSNSTKMATCNPGTGPAMKAEFPEVTDYARAVHQSLFMGGVAAWSHTDNEGSMKVFNEELLYDVDPSFLTVFDFPFVLGNPHDVLSDPKSVVVSETVAKKFFGKDNPLGKTMVLNGRRDFTVTGVFKDVPENSHIKFNILTSYFLKNGWDGFWNDDWDWKWSEFETYVVLDNSANAIELESKLSTLVEKYAGARLRGMNQREELHLQPLTDIHLRSPKLTNERQTHGSEQTINFLMIIAALILIIAWINYINLSTSKSIERAQEVGLRKVAGASRRQLVTQFLLESFAVNFLAIVLSFVIVIVTLPYFNQLLEKDILEGVQLNDIWFWLALIGVFVLGSFIAGLYPAFVLSSYRIMNVLKGKFFGTRSGIALRKTLVGFQFVITVILMAGTVVVFQQVSFMRNQDLGYSKEQLLIIQSPKVTDSTIHSKGLVFKTELLRNTTIHNVTKTNEIPGKAITQMNFLRRMDQDLEDNFLCNHFFMDLNFIDTYGVKLVAGRNFRQGEEFIWEESATHPVILNEKAIRMLGFQSTTEAINQRAYFGLGSKQEWIGEIVGITGDFHQQSLKNDYDPIIFFPALDSRFFGQYVTLKVSTEYPEETISFVEMEYKKLFPGNQFNYFFLDDHFNRQYAADQQFGKIFGLFSTLALVIAGLGLFGLSTFMISQRIKEIAVRKVLGATIPGMIVLFSKDFVKLVILASFIAGPIVYLVVDNWLKSFAFHVPIGWVMFVVPPIVLLVISLATIAVQTIKTGSVNPTKSLRLE